MYACRNIEYCICLIVLVVSLVSVQSEVDAQVAILLRLKADYKKLTGEDASRAPSSQTKKEKPAKQKDSAAKEKVKEAGKSVYEEKITAIIPVKNVSV